MTQTELNAAREMVSYYSELLAEDQTSAQRVHSIFWRDYYAAKARDLAWIEKPALVGSAAA